MSPEEFARQMRVIIDGTKGDPEIVHGLTDDLMEETLIALGYGEGVDLVRDTTRWYA